MRKLAVFALLSVLVHMIVAADIAPPMPWQQVDAPPLRARLQAAPTLPPVLPRRVIPTPQSAPAQEAAKSASAANYADHTLSPAAPGEERVSGTETAATTTKAGDAEVATQEPVASTAAATNKPSLARRLPRQGEITYQLYLGNNRFNVGSTVQTWLITEDRYHLSSRSETTGLAALFSRQSMEYVSSGRLTAGGLHPDTFSSERQRGGNKDSTTARFDRVARTITFGNPPRSLPLNENAQDLVSFMYQLGLLPLTPGRIEIPITNGWKFERYELEIGIEETLQTPFGEIRAVPVRQVRRAREESIELWLAPAYRWLPVRIRFFDREGEPSGEQLVNDIKVSEE